VIEGRHPDPFHYLGVHVEGDHPVVRAFVPDAEEVVAIDNEGHESELARVTRLGCLPGGSRMARRATICGRGSGSVWSSFRTPTAFRPCCPTSISICSARAISSSSTTSSGRTR